MFEKSYRFAACKILEKYGDYSEKLSEVSEDREKELIILGEHNIHANPSYIYLKGCGELELKNGTIIKTVSEYPIALSTQAVEGVKQFQVKSSAVMTVENLTTFHRMQSEGIFYIYLSG